MREELRRINISLLLGLTIALIIILVKNLLSSSLFKDVTYGMPALIERGEIDNLYLGSSVFRQGIDIETLDTNGEQNYILAYNGLQPELEALILQHLVDKGVSINHLYIDMYLVTAMSSTRLEDDKLILESDWNLKRKIFATLPDKSLSSFINYYITSGNTLLFTWLLNKPVISRQFRDGGTLLESEGMSQEGFDTLTSFILTNQMDDKQVKAIRDIARICMNHGIELTFVALPKPSSIEYDEAYEGGMNIYRAILKDSGVNHVELSQFPRNVPSMFQDRVHLSSEGRRIATEQLLKEIDRVAN